MELRGAIWEKNELIMRDRSGQGPPSTSQKEDILQRMKEKQQSFYTEGRRKEFNWSVITLHVWSDTSWGDYPQSSVRAHYSSPRVISSCHLMSQKKFFFLSQVSQHCVENDTLLSRKRKCSLRAVQLHSFQDMDPMFGAPGRPLRNMTLNSRWQILGRVTEGTRMWFKPVQGQSYFHCTEWVNKVGDRWTFQINEDPSSFRHWHTLGPRIFERKLSSMHQIFLEALKKGKDTWEKTTGLGDWRTYISGGAPPLPGWARLGVYHCHYEENDRIWCVTLLNNRR